MESNLTKSYETSLTAVRRHALLIRRFPKFTEVDTKMKILLLSMWLCMGATSAFAQNVGANVSVGGTSVGVNATIRSAPAPLLGAGIPAALAIGGVLLGAKLLGRKRQSKK
jgi:hypothetical protein